MQATHPRRPDPLTHEEACEIIEQLSSHRVQENTFEIVESALELKKRYQTSFWDASILAAAMGAGCDSIFSEDLSHGQRYGDLIVVNPFLTF